MRQPNRVNQDWETPKQFTWEHVSIELLMDIRAELQRLNSVIHCPNFLRVPSKLDQIRRNTAKPKGKT